jgi:hypothetical protein
VDLSAPVPRGGDGRPDLSGLWGTPEVGVEFFESDQVQGWALEAIAESERNYYGDDPRFNCLPTGPQMVIGGLRRIVHTPTFVAFLYRDLTYRQIFLDGRALETDPFPTWMGYSVGHWEGDTLVVQSNGYNDKTWLTTLGLPHTENLQITERYRRTDFGHIELQVTYDDPDTFNAPVEATVGLRFVADNELLEEVCNEASKGRNHWSGDISDAEELTVEVDEATLAKYVGIYEGTWLGNLIKADVRLEDGALVLYRNPPYTESRRRDEYAQYAMIPQSDNAFECSCGLGFVFTGSNEDGMATEVLEVHVSGSWLFERVP